MQLSRAAPAAECRARAPAPRSSSCGRRRATAAAAASAGAVASADAPGVLSPEQLQRFSEDGFLALPSFASAETVAALRQRADSLVAGWDPYAGAARLSVFSTREEQAHAKDAYFLDSASEVNFFVEEKAYDGAGRLAVPKAAAVNKIGHALHDLDPVFAAFTRSEPVARLARSLGFRRPLPVQSMYIFKGPRIGGEVSPHQDSSFLYTDPPSCVGFWLALDDANRTNGCLWAMSGIHKQGLARRFRRLPEGGVGFDGPAPSYDLSQAVPIECAAGTLVVLHGANVHFSAENTSEVARHAFTLHLVEGHATWAADNWAHRRPELPWQPLYDNAVA